MKRIVNLLFLFAAITICSCSIPKGIDPDAGLHWRGKLHSVEHIALTDIKTIAENLGDDMNIDSLHFDKKLKYPVDAYRITYYTQYNLDIRKAEIVLANALLVVPHGCDKTEFMAYFHGTVMPLPDVTSLFAMGTPSTYDGKIGTTEVNKCLLPLASSGYCVICPDYTGFGPTADRDHAFIYYPELFMSAYDGVIAGVRAMEDKNYGINRKIDGDIWLSGWSQGGGMALYFQRELENNPAYKNKFNIKGTSTLAGPYNIEHFMMDVFQHPDDVYLLMALYGWAGYCVNRFAPELQRPMDQVFRARIYDQTDSFAIFGSTPHDVYQGFFIQKLIEDKDPIFKQVLRQISTDRDWSPVAPIFLHHGTDDSLVPYFNSVDAYNGLRDSARGGISLFSYKGEDHTTFVPTYISKVIDEFEELKNKESQK